MKCTYFFKLGYSCETLCDCGIRVHLLSSPHMCMRTQTHRQYIIGISRHTQKTAVVSDLCYQIAGY